MITTRKKMNKTGRTVRELSSRCLAFSEKFTTLGKVIANTLNIALPWRNIGFTVLFLAITLLISSSDILRHEFKIKTVVIDAGHGGKDPGTHGTDLKEKDVVLKIALKLGEYIEKNYPEVKVIYTRKTDKFIELKERAAIANRNKAELFISIHANAIPNSTTFGTETWVMGLHKSEANLTVAKRENSVILKEDNYEEKYQGFDNTPESYIMMSLTQSAYLESSVKFADKIEKQFKSKAGRNSRGVKQAGFIVLYETSTPSVLVEVGFLTNAKEEKFLGTAEGQDLIASGIYRAFKEYKSEVESIN
jgi:N-acetylmuramoyl-L-alanine amidase